MAIAGFRQSTACFNQSQGVAIALRHRLHAAVSPCCDFRREPAHPGVVVTEAARVYFCISLPLGCTLIKLHACRMHFSRCHVRSHPDHPVLAAAHWCSCSVCSGVTLTCTHCCPSLHGSWPLYSTDTSWTQCSWCQTSAANATEAMMSCQPELSLGGVAVACHQASHAATGQHGSLQRLCHGTGLQCGWTR